MKNRLVWPANYSTIVVVVVVLCGQALQQVAVIQTRLNFSRQNHTLSFDILILRCAVSGNYVTSFSTARQHNAASCMPSVIPLMAFSKPTSVRLSHSVFVFPIGKQSIAMSVSVCLCV